MRDKEDTLVLIFFGCSYCFLFCFAYWFVNSVHALENQVIEQQSVEYK